MELSNKNIADAVEEIRDFFQQAGISKKDVLKICLVIEEALLRYSDHFGENHSFELYLRVRRESPLL